MLSVIGTSKKLPVPAQFWFRVFAERVMLKLHQHPAWCFARILEPD
jgi:hypothetical protein